MQVMMIGLDLAKNVFQVHGVDARERPVLRKRLSRTKVLEFFAQLPPCRVGMEACPGAHWWARQLLQLGHDVKLMPPQYVRPYVKRNKNDAADAEAICEALTRPSMRFVPVKSLEQQSALLLHRTRDLLVAQRTQLANALRGHLAEFGGSARSPRLRWSRPWAIRPTYARDGNLRPGSVSSHASVRAAGRNGSAASASAATVTSGGCSCTVPARSCVGRSAA